MQRLDLKDVNRFFNAPLPRPSPTKSFTVEDERWLQQFYARLHSRDGSSSDGSSPSSSSITLTNEDEDVISTSKANKYQLWSEPVPDHQAANTWSKAQSQLASAKGARYLPPPPSQAGFNPHAPAFVPSQQRQGPPSKPPHQPAMPLPEPPQSPRSQPSWYSPFMAGTSALSIEEQHAHAVGVVSHRPWTPESLAHLAQHFCWKGTKGMSKGNAGHKGQVVVSFVKVVVCEFGQSCGDWYASSFMWHLGECAVGTFKSCWKLGYMSRNGTPVALSSLCTFIGALYSHCLLPSSPIHLCFQLLLSELNAVEHVRAIHALILNSGEKLWMGREGGIALRDVHTAFTQRVSAMNLKGSSRVEVDKYVKEVTDMLNRWHTARFIEPAGPSHRV